MGSIFSCGVSSWSMAIGMLVVVVVIHVFTDGVGEFTGVSLCVHVQSSFVCGLDAV